MADEAHQDRFEDSLFDEFSDSKGQSTHNMRRLIGPKLPIDFTYF